MLLYVSNVLRYTATFLLLVGRSDDLEALRIDHTLGFETFDKMRCTALDPNDWESFERRFMRNLTKPF